MPAPLLEVRDLKTHFFTEDGITRAVDGLSYEIGAGETLGIVGESGCGKSVAALSVLRLLPDRIGRTVAGSIRFDGVELLALSEGDMRDIRGNRIAMIFQEPMTSLNPVLTIGHQIAEAFRVHKGFGRKRGARARPPHARGCAHPGRAEPSRRLSTSVLRWHAPAGDDRHGARLHPQAVDCRRADHGA